MEERGMGGNGAGASLPGRMIKRMNRKELN
jgi:hypothetical protein